MALPENPTFNDMLKAIRGLEFGSGMVIEKIINPNNAANAFTLSGRKAGIYILCNVDGEIRGYSPAYFKNIPEQTTASSANTNFPFLYIPNDIPENANNFNSAAYLLAPNEMYTINIISNAPSAIGGGLFFSVSTNYMVFRNAVQDWTAKQIFYTLPESSVTPTTDNQFVNKKYADGVSERKIQVVTPVSGTATINLSPTNLQDGNIFRVTPSAAITIANSNATPDLIH